MKFPLAVVLSFACVAGQAAESSSSSSSQSGASKKALPRIVLPPDRPASRAQPPPKPGPDATAVAEAKKATPEAEAKSAAKKKEEEPPAKIEGITIPRGDGFLGIQIVDATFKLSFYDAKKKPVAADVDRAALRWDPKYKIGEERVVLNRSEDGKALTSPKNIRPPYHFKLFITLIKEAADGQPPANETFTVDFRQ